MAKKIDNVINTIDKTADNIKNLSFGDFWSGEASNKQISLLDSLSNNIKNISNNLVLFKTNVMELGKYKELLEIIKEKETQLSAMNQYTIYRNNNGKEYRKEDPDYTALFVEIGKLKKEALDKKNKLIKYFNSVSSILDNFVPKLNYVDPNSVDYKGIDNLINVFFSNTKGYPMIGGSFSPSTDGGLYRVYSNYGGRDYVFNRLKNAINSTSSNRQKSVNAVVELFNLTTAAGIKLPYINKGAGSDGSFVTTDCVATGVDCNAFVCWAVDKGVNNGFQWRPCSGSNGLTNVGKNIEFNEWGRGKPGDVLSRGVNGEHSAYVLRNYPEKRMFILAQASGQRVGITLTPVSYDRLRRQGMVLRDMDDVYSGVDQASRFNQYQDKTSENYSEVNTDLHL